MTLIRGRLDAEGAAVLRTALDPFTAPTPSTADGPGSAVTRPVGRPTG